jgi:hypothetical protein
LSLLTYTNKILTYEGHILSYTLGSSYPAVLNDGNTVGWYLADDLTTLTLIDTSVSRWNDKLGSGRDLIQATGSYQPLWVTPGTIRFDGIDNYLKTDAFTYGQPAFVYILFKQITWSDSDRIFAGNVASSNALTQGTSTPIIRQVCSTGPTGADSGELTVGTWGIVRLLYNGASSRIQVNNGVVDTGNAFTTIFGGITLGRRGDSNDYYGNFEVKEIILRNVADSAPDETAIYNYLVTRLPV